MDIKEIYRVKIAAEAEIAYILKGFTLSTGMEADGVEIVPIPTKEEKINTYYRVKLNVKL